MIDRHFNNANLELLIQVKVFLLSICHSNLLEKNSDCSNESNEIICTLNFRPHLNRKTSRQMHK